MELEYSYQLCASKPMMLCAPASSAQPPPFILTATSAHLYWWSSVYRESRY